MLLSRAQKKIAGHEEVFAGFRVGYGDGGSGVLIF
jgi:hypothetical protein